MKPRTTGSWLKQGCANNSRSDRCALGVCFFSRYMGSLLDPALPPRYGGAELQMYVTARELAKDERFEVHFVVDEIPNRARPPQGVNLHLFPPMISKGIPGVSAARNIWRWVRFLRSTGCDWSIQMGASGLTVDLTRASRLAGKHVAFWLSSDADVRGEKLAGRPELRRRYLKALERVDALFAQHSGQIEELRAEGLDPRLLRGGFPMPRERPFRPREFVLWVASCQRLKQPELFLELARRIPDIPFVMIMTPREQAYFEEIVSHASEVPNLEVKAGVPDVREYYDRAIALVNLSTVEGMPNTFIEAAISGTPVFSLNVDPDGMLSEHGAGFFASGDLDLLVGRLSAAVGDGDAWSRMSDAAWSYATANHDITKTVDSLKLALLGSPERSR